MAEPETPPFRVDASEQGPVLRSLAVEVEEAGVSSAFERVYRDLAKSVRIKGFRPGKAPRGVLERMYGATVRETLGLGEEQILFTGLAIGHADTGAAVNQWPVPRVGLDEVIDWRGFDQ